MTILLLFVGAGLLITLLSVPFLRRAVGRNDLFGLRTAETLRNDDVWYEANVRAVRWQVRVGILNIIVPASLIAFPLQSSDRAAYVCCAVLLTSVLGYLVFSLRMAKDVETELGME